MNIAGWLSLGVGLLGCGGHTKAATAPPPMRVEAATPEEREPYAEVVSPNRAPAGELDGMWLHLRSPTELWRNLPRLAQDLPALAMLESVSSARHLPADVAAIVDLSQPVDVVAPLPDLLQMTWGFRVRSPEAILRGTAGLTLRRVEAGAWDIGGVAAAPDIAEGGEDEEGWEGGVREMPSVRCRLLHLPAPVGYRVVCGRDYRRLSASADFLTAPARVLDAQVDLHLELSGPTYDELKGQRLLAMALSRPGVSSSGERGVVLVADFAKAFYEHRRATFDVSLQGTSARAQIALEYPARMESARFAAWLSHARQRALPSSSADLPSDGGLLLTSSGVGEPGLRYVLSELGAGIADDCVISPAQLSELDSSLSALLPSDGRISVAYGFDADAAYAALNDPARRLADETERALPAAVVRRLQAALGGWVVLGLDVPPERFLPAARRLHRLSQLDLPLEPGNTAADPGSSSDVKLVAAPPGLPVGTLHFIEHVRARKLAEVDGARSPALPFDRHYLVVPDGKRVWVVLARSGSVASTRARSLLGSERRPFAWPSSAPPESAALLGVVDLRTLVALGWGWDSREERVDVAAALARFNQAPRRGASRVPLRVDVVPGAANDGSHLVRIQTEVDWAELLMQASALVPPEPAEE